MKKYNTPNAEFAKFNTEDVMTLSSTGAPAEKIEVNGLSLDATNFGAQDFSIFNNNK